MTTENRTHETHHLIDRIIVGVDGTDPSIRAADWAADLAHQLRADVVLMEALVRPYSEISPPIDRALQRAERTHVTDEVDGDGSLADAEVEVAEGEPGDTLAFAAADAQLLVIGSKETEGVGRHGFFSLAHALAHHTPCPMLVVPHDAQPLHATPTVLIGVDGSDGNRNAFEWTLRLAEQLGASVTAAFVTDPMYDTFDSAGSYGPEEVAARGGARCARRDVHRSGRRRPGEDPPGACRRSTSRHADRQRPVASLDRRAAAGEDPGRTAAPPHVPHRRRPARLRRCLT